MYIIQGKKDEIIERKKRIRNIRTNKYRQIFLELYSNSDDISKRCFYGVKWIVYHNLEDNYTCDLMSLLMWSDVVLHSLSLLTYRQFIELFPIIKEYDGGKYECKDYYSTKEYLKNINLDNVIGNNVDELLWNYYNHDVMNFSIKQMLIMDRLRRFSGGKGLLEQFIDDNNLEVDSYRINREYGYIINNRTGQVGPLKEVKAKPKHLQVVK